MFAYCQRRAARNARPLLAAPQLSHIHHPRTPQKITFTRRLRPLCFPFPLSFPTFSCTTFFRFSNRSIHIRYETEEFRLHDLRRRLVSIVSFSSRRLIGSGSDVHCKQVLRFHLLKKLAIETPIRCIVARYLASSENRARFRAPLIPIVTGVL